MDLQDQKKTTPSAHESQGVYVCHQCGWLYPKQHPSSKHRRAHKRVCGKVEGHTLLKSDSDPLHLSVSDDDRLSDDDDRRTPSPKVDKENVNKIGSSGGNVLRSYRSEDDVFSDAFTEFSDSGASPGIDARLRSGEKLDADVKGALAAIDLTNNIVSKDCETSGKTETLLDPFESTLPKSPVTGTTTIGSEVVGTEMCLSDSTEPAGETEDYAEQNDLASKFAQVSSEPIVHSENGKHEKEELITSVHADNLANKVGDDSTENVGVSNGCTGQNGLATNSAQVIDKPIFHPENVKHEKEEPITSVHADLANKVGLGTDSQYIKSQAAGDAAQLECKFGDTEEQCSDPVTSECMLPEIGTEISYPLSMREYNLEDSKALTAGAVAETVEENEEELVSKLQTETRTHDISSQPCSISGSVPIKEEVDLDIGSTNRTFGQPSGFSDLKEEGSIDTKISVTETLAELEKPEIFSGDFKDLRVFKSNIPLDLGDTEVTVSADDKNEATDPEEHESILSSDLVTLNKSSSNLDDNEVEIQKAVLSPDEVLVTSGSMAKPDEVWRNNGSETPLGYSNDNQTNKDHKDFQPYSDDAKPLKPDNSELVTGEHLDVIMPSIGEGTSHNTTLNKDANVDANGMAESLHVRNENENIEEGDVHLGKGTAMSAHAEGPVETEDVQCPNPLAEGFVAPENLVSHSDNNHESFQHLTNSSESDLFVDSEQENISLRDLGNLADFSTSCNSLDEHKNVKDFVVSMPLPDEGDDRMAKHLDASPVDMSVPSSRRTDSLEGNWGSASVVSNQSDVAAIGETEVPVLSDSQITGKLEENSMDSQDNAKEYHLEKAEDFEPPSFATLVQSGFQHNQKDAVSELQKDGQPKSEAVEAGWFPSITNVVNESEGRKKNKEIIAKVTNWSAGKQQHSPLKSLLNEAHEVTYAIQPPSEPKQASGTDQAHEIGLKNNGKGGAVTTTVSSIMGSDHAAANKEMEKEWDSPARYPTAIKKEKRKGKPYWVPFVCCSSMHRDI